MAKKIRIGIAVFLGVIILAIVTFASCIAYGGPRLRSDIKYWESGDYSKLIYSKELNTLLPPYEDNKNYISADFYYHQGFGLEYATAAYCLQLKLDDSVYTSMRQNALNEFAFTEKLCAIRVEREILNLENYNIGKYNFKFIKTDHDVKDIEFVAFNESDKIIRYGYLFSESLDYFNNAKEFQKWITNNLRIGW